jgi:hypothetical protein
MKKTIIKAFVVLACMTVGITNVVRCQIYSNEDCFYASAGSSYVSYVVKFEYSTDRVWIKSVSHSTVRRNLAQNRDFYEEETWTDGKNSVNMYEYDRSMSTSTREVYKRVTKIAIYDPNCRVAQASWGVNGCKVFGFNGTPTGCGAHGYKDGDTYYVAFSKDKSSYYSWRVSANDVDGTIRNKSTYTRIPKEDLLPKAANYDFLNE